MAVDGHLDLLEESIGWVERYAEALDQAQLRRLLTVAEQHLERQGDATLAVDEAFDINEEIHMMIRALRGLRKNVITDTGHMLDGKDTRDVKEVISSSTSLFSLLLKAQEKMDYVARMQAIEEAAVAAARELDDAAQAAFFACLEDRLEAA